MECPRGSPPRARGRVLPSPPAAPPLRAAITSSRRAFSQARAPRPFCLWLGPGRRARECGCTQLQFRAHPGAPRSSGPRSSSPVPGCPAYPTPARIWRRTRHRRALLVSGSAVTRAALAPPRATSPAPGAATLLRPNKEAPGRRGACRARTGRAGPKGQGRRRRSQSGFCATTRPAAEAETALGRRTERTAPPPLPRAREGPKSRCLRRPTATQ